MAQKSVSVTATSGSATVTLSDTSGIIAGKSFFKRSNEGVPGAYPDVYQVSSIVADTSVTLTANYNGTSGTFTGLFVNDFTSNRDLPLIYTGDLDIPDFMNRAFNSLDGAVFNNDASMSTTDGIFTGQVVVGDSAVGVSYTSVDTLVVGDGTGNQGLVIDSGSSNQGIITFGDGGNAGRITYDHSDNSLTLRSNSTDQVELNSSGDLMCQNGIALGGGTDTMDEYEEGTFTPAITFPTAGDLSVAYSVQVGRYTRIGNRVFCDFSISTSSFTHTTASGNIRITGLPFTVKNTTNYLPQGALQFGGITKASYTSFNVQSVINTTYANIRASGSGQSPTSCNVSDFPSGGSVILRGQAYYEV